MILHAVADDLQARTISAEPRDNGSHFVHVAWSDLIPKASAASVDAIIGEMSRGHATFQLGVLRGVRELAPRIPILVTLDEPTATVLNSLHLLGISVCGKPLSTDNLARFIAEAHADEALDEDVLHARVKRASSHNGLTRRESELLRLATSGIPRRTIAERLGVSENTVKAQIRSLLRKTGARNLAVLGQQLLRGDASGPAEG